jgi:hypothetical protein
MSDQSLMTEILTKLLGITDPDCLDKIQHTAFNRKRELRQKTARVETATWKVGDEVQIIPEHQSRKPYGAVGVIKKINKVKMKVDFPIGCYNVPKTMLMRSTK